MPIKDKNKVQIDITGNEAQLNESLKDSESVIASFGKKITSSFSKIISISNDLKNGVVDTFTRGSQAVIDFTNNLKDSSIAAGSLRSVWQRTQSYLANYILDVREVIILHKDLAKVNQLVDKSTGYSTKSLQIYAEHLEKITKFSAETTKSAMQLIMHFRNIHGDDFLAATRAAQDLATELRTDLNSAAQLVGESLNDPVAALQKLASANIFFTESEEKAVKRAMEANNVLLAQNLILGKLNKSFGGAAKAAGDTFYGKLDRLKNVLHTIGTKIGETVYNRFNQIFNEMYKGSRIFDTIIQKITDWGNITIATIDTLLPKIFDFIGSFKLNFEIIYDWLIDATINTFTVVQTIISHASEIIHELNLFLFSSFSKIWSGIAEIFTVILPKSYQYMAEVFSNVINNIIKGAESFWYKMKLFSIVAFNNISLEIVKFFIKVEKWLIQLGSMLIPWVRSLSIPLRLLFGVTLSDILNKAEKALDDFVDKSKQAYPELFSGYNFENPFKNVDIPDFSESVDDIKASMNLTTEWGKLLDNISNNFGDEFKDNVEKNKKQFNSLINDIKNKAKGQKLLEDPRLKIEQDRRKDDLKKEKGFVSKMVSGLEEFWYKGASEQSKNTSAIKENTAALKNEKKKTPAELKKENVEKKENKAKNADEDKAAKRREQQEKRFNYLRKQGRVKEVLSEEETQKKENEKLDRTHAMQVRLHGMSDKEIKELNELSDKARDGNASTNEIDRMFELNQKEMDRAEKISRMKKKSESGREELIARAKQNRERQELLSGMGSKTNNFAIDKNTKASKASASNRGDSKKELSQDNVKVAMRDANRDLISELRQVTKNTKEAADNLKKIGSA